MIKIVITGGHFAGKTTLIKALSQKNYYTISETGMEIVAQLVKKMGVSEQRIWRSQNFDKVELSIAKQQIKKEEEVLKKANGHPVFLDRGIHDCLAYCFLKKTPIPTGLLPLLEKSKYDKIFICDTLKSFSPRNETGRTSLTINDSLQFNNLLREVYTKYQYQLITVPEMTIEKRVEFVTSYLD